MDYKQRVLRSLTDIQEKIILLANAGKAPINGRTWLQKELFLLSERIEDLKKESSYEPDLMGPYSDTVEEELTQLENIGVISVDNHKISLTSRGKDIAKNLEAKEDPAVLEHIKNFKDFLNDLTENELLCYVYLAHPEMTVESVKYERLKPKVEGIVLNLVQKEKISINRAAELLQKNNVYVVDKLKKHGQTVLS